MVFPPKKAKYILLYVEIPSNYHILFAYIYVHRFILDPPKVGFIEHHPWGTTRLICKLQSQIGQKELKILREIEPIVNQPTGTLPETFAPGKRPGSKRIIFQPLIFSEASY